MSASVVVMSTAKPAADTTELLRTIETLREAVVEGRIVGFVAAGLNALDETYWWSASTGGVTRLRMMGAIANLQHQYSAGAGDEGADET